MSVSRKRKAPPSTDIQLSFIEKYDRRPPKKCDRRGCDRFGSYPFCFVQSTERCAKYGYTSRWYHLSAGQHFCNECFEYFYRSNKPGNTLYTQWCTVWEREAGDSIAAGPKMFLVDQYLPIWVQCTVEGCQKWRKLPPSIELHHVKQEIVRCSSCQQPEDEVVRMAKEMEWISTVSYIPMLRYSILSPLLSEYFPDGVGISPTTVKHVSRSLVVQAMSESSGGGGQPGELDKKSPNGPVPLPALLCDPLHPFNHPQEGPRARAFTPDIMEPEEIRTFPEYYRVYETTTKWHSPKLEMFCIMRNLILALWFRNCKEYLTPEKCTRALSLRGIIRIWCSKELPRILRFLTEQGYVNCGFMINTPRPFPYAGNTQGKSSVLIIGAGTAGLVVANHLKNFGHQVKILEANGRIGGRVKDDFSMGPCVGLGAMFITGICNNPLTLLCRQVGIDLRLISEDHCELINEGGLRPDRMVDGVVEKHFNSALDKLSEWRSEQSIDTSLGEKLEHLHKGILMEQRQNLFYSEEESRLLDFHYSNLEFACGATLDKVSAFHWDHNDTFSQFSGCHALLPDGYMSILSRLASPLEIHLNTVVKGVGMRGDGKVCVVDAKGKEWGADKVVVTVPLAVLKQGTISFTPPLTERKSGAIARMGAGVVEKVALKFPAPFWRKNLGNTDFFGHVASSRQRRGMFGVFYDMSPRENNKPNQSTSATIKDIFKAYILVTTVSGEALKDYQQMTDSQIVELCVKTLKMMFPEETVSQPLGYVLTRWGSDPHAQMSYSYVAVGGSGEDYDILAEEVEGKIFFAGEATNRQYPQTVTGAYLSGIREACKIIHADKS